MATLTKPVKPAPFGKPHFLLSYAQAGFRNGMHSAFPTALEMWQHIIITLPAPSN